VAAVLKAHGVLDVVDCRGDDVPEGKLTSLPMAVTCTPSVATRRRKAFARRSESSPQVDFGDDSGLHTNANDP